MNWSRFVYTCILLLCWIPGMVYGQNLSKSEVDSIYKKAIPKLREEGDVLTALKLSQNALASSIATEYTEGGIEGYLLTANILNVLGKHKESLDLLDLANKPIQDYNDPFSNARMHSEYGRGYMNLGLHEQSLIHFKRAHQHLESIPDKAKRNKHMPYVYSLESVLYEKINDTLNLLNSIRKAYQLYPSPFNASRLVKFYTVYSPALDSASLYLRRGDSLHTTGRYEIHQYAMLLRNKGRYYMALKDHARAIKSYKESADISKKGGKYQDVRDTYKLLFEAYQAVKEKDSTQKFLLAYTMLNDSINQSLVKTLDVPIKKLIQKQEAEGTEEKNRLYWLIAVFIASALGIGVYAYKIRAKKRENQQLLLIKEKETYQLQQKVNESFDDLLELARNNHMHFYVRFQEVYPNIHNRLLEITPDLLNTELKLCAFIYLDFTTKEIADCTATSVRTVQNRKYTLRKRLQIASSDDLYVWIKQLDQRNTSL